MPSESLSVTTSTSGPKGLLKIDMAVSGCRLWMNSASSLLFPLGSQTPNTRKVPFAPGRCLGSSSASLKTARLDFEWSKVRYNRCAASATVSGFAWWRPFASPSASTKLASDVDVGSQLHVCAQIRAEPFDESVTQCLRMILVIRGFE